MHRHTFLGKLPQDLVYQIFYPVVLTKSCSFTFRQNERHISQRLLDSTANNHTKPHFIEHKKHMVVSSLTCIFK